MVVDDGEGEFRARALGRADEVDDEPVDEGLEPGSFPLGVDKNSSEGDEMGATPRIRHWRRRILLTLGVAVALLVAAWFGLGALLPEASTTRARTGAGIFSEAGCAGCHTLAAADAEG